MIPAPGNALRQLHGNTRSWHLAKARKDQRLTPRSTISGHDLRHAHASWLLAGGADLQVVKERLGYASIMTTQKYLHTLPDAEETALDAFAKIRNRGREGWTLSCI